MCWVCEHLEGLIETWNEEREFQEQTSSDDYHRGLTRSYSDCSKDLSDSLSSMRLKGLCGKFQTSVDNIRGLQKYDFLNDMLKLGNEDKDRR
jgi:hypothetical protein